MFRIDDNFPDCQKVARLEQEHPKAFANCIVLWTFAGCFSSRTAQDGYVSAAALKRIAPIKRHKMAAEALVKVGLWEPVEGGYKFHDWATWNELKVDKQRRIQDNALRQKRYRDRKSNALHDDDATCDKRVSVTPPNTNTNTNTNTKEKTTASPGYRWQSVIKTIVDETGQLIDLHAHQKSAEAILRLAQTCSKNDPGSVVRRAAVAWWENDWVQQTRPSPAHLARNFDEFANAHKAPPKKRPVDPEALKEIRRKLVNAKNDLEICKSIDQERIPAVERAIARLEQQKRESEG